MLLDDVVSRIRRDVRVDPEGADVEGPADGSPEKRPVHDRDRLDLVEMCALPAVRHAGSLASAHDRDGVRIHEVPLAREEARMACLEHELLVVLRVEDGQIVVVHDSMAGDAVVDRRIRELDRDRVARPELVDVAERCTVRRPVAGDVDELVLAGHEGLQVTPRASPEVGHARPVHDHRVEPESRDAQPGDRVAVTAGEAIATGLAPHVVLPRLGLGGLHDRTPGRLVGLELLVELRRKLPLLVGCVRRRERVLPEVHGGCPSQDSDADDEKERADAMLMTRSE